MSLDYSLFHPVCLEDRARLQPILDATKARSCEFAFANLYGWQEVCGTLFAIVGGTLWVHLSVDDVLLFCGAPSKREIADIVGCVQRAGYRGTVRAFEGLPGNLSATPAPESLSEYLYRIDDLALLKGSRYAPKRNLIAQFHERHPKVQTIPIKPNLYSACLSLMEAWVRAHAVAVTDNVSLEFRAASHLFAAGLDHIGAEGIALLDGTELLAFSIFAPIANGVWAEPYEKARIEEKGAYQAILQATAQALLGRGELLNREQDLGLAGLRKAKQSWHPCELIAPMTIHP